MDMEQYLSEDVSLAYDVVLSAYKFVSMGSLVKYVVDKLDTTETDARAFIKSVILD